MSISSIVRKSMNIGAAVVMAFTGVALTGAVEAAPAAAAVTVTSHFIWTATSSNIDDFVTEINNDATNGQPNALLFVTPTYDPGGVCGCVLDTAPLAVFWAGNANEWTIGNEDLSTMPVGASFNVLVVEKPTSQAFVDTATATNTTANGTVIDAKAINGKGNALLQVTQSMSAGLGSTLNEHPIGVVYGLGTTGNQWAIQNLDNATMPVGAKFNVLVGSKPSNGGKAVLLTGTSTNTSGSSSFISNTETTGNPNTVIFDTENADPSLNFGAGDPVQTGVVYDTTSDIAAVFNEGGTSMPTTTYYFNLLIFAS